MKNTVFEGAATAIITPFFEDGSVDYDSFGRLIDFQIAGGIDAIVVAGTTGEGSTLSDEEHREVMRYCVERVAHRVPVIAGTGSNDTAYAIELTKAACEMGADAMLLVTPYYNKATQGGLIKSFSLIADESDKPCILYNVPSRTGSNILPETAARLGREVDNIVAIKEASGNISQVGKLAALCDGVLDIYSGNDDQIVPICALGGIGVISVLSNVAPKETHNIVQYCLMNRYDKARQLQHKALELCNALFCEVNPIPVKAALNMQGYKVGDPRLPLTEMEPANKERLRKAMIEFGCL